MWTVEFYTDSRGDSPVEEYTESLSFKDKVKITRYLQLLEEFGTELRFPVIEYIGDGLWQLRPGSSRLFYFLFTKEMFVILHGFRKKSQKTPRKEIATAKRRRDDYLRRKEDAQNI